MGIRAKLVPSPEPAPVTIAIRPERRRVASGVELGRAVDGPGRRREGQASPSVLVSVLGLLICDDTAVRGAIGLVIAS